MPGTKLKKKTGSGNGILKQFVTGTPIYKNEASVANKSFYTYIRYIELELNKNLR